MYTYKRHSRTSTTRTPTIVIAVMLLALSACGRTSGPERETRFLLGTSSTISIFDDSYPSDLMDRAFARVEEIQDRMSINESEYDDTELLRINRNAGSEAVPVSADTAFVLREGIRWGDLTDGAFDISIAPLVTLWGIGTPRENVPDEEQIVERRAFVDYRRVVLDETAPSVRLPEESMAIDVGGIAKGYAVDEAARILVEAGIEHAIIDFGGDIYTVGRRTDGNPWRIGIQHPSAERQQLLAVIESSHQAVVSSGNYERYFVENDVRYHHILDPRTGAPARTGLTSVTIIGPDAIGADALSTGAFVMGLERGMQLVESLDEYEGVFATTDGTLYATAGVIDGVEIRADDHELIRAE